MTGRMAGQTLNDRILAAKHSLAGQGLAKSVCKATTEEMIGPKKKHLDYLVHCTNEPNVSIPQLANLLIERSQNTNWLVVYKALITAHHMMCYGNERFTQFLASSNSTFQLSNFLDKGGVQGALSTRIGYDMSPFIRRYSRYLNEKALSYRTVAFDFCKIKRGKEDGMLRTMNADKLLKTLPTLQNQLDALLEFDCSANDLTNGVINMCFMLLFRDLIRLFACYNDGIINLLEKYFDMNKKQCRDALDIYKKFLIRMDRVAEFLKVAENVGIDKGDIPDLTKAPSSLLEALEQHLQYIEGKNKSSANSTPQSASNQKNVRSGVSALSSTSSSFGTAVANVDAQANNIDETLRLKALAEEEAAINQFKSKVQNSRTVANNPFLNSTPTITTTVANSQPSSIDDLFASEPIISNSQQLKASDDLLQLGNPFAENFSQPNHNVYNQQLSSQNLWMTNGNAYANVSVPPPVNGSFVSESSFNSVFGNETTKFSPSSDVLQPMSLQPGQQSTPQQMNNSRNSPQPTSALLTGDLETSLASLAENLSINNRPPPVKSVQWNSPKNGSKVGNTWSPQPMSATTGAGYKPMNQTMHSTTQPTMVQPQMYQTMQPIMGMRPMVGNPTLMQPMHGMAPTPQTTSMNQQSLLFH